MSASSSSDSALTTNQIPISLDLPKDPDRFHEHLTLYLKRMAQALNTKEGGLYTLQEFYASKQYYQVTDNRNSQVFRNVYRKVFDMTLLNGGNAIASGQTVSFPHGINGLFIPTTIFGGAASDNINATYLPLPYVSATTLTDQIQIFLTPTNVVLVNGTTQGQLGSAIIVAEYLKN